MDEVSLIEHQRKIDKLMAEKEELENNIAMLKSEIEMDKAVDMPVEIAEIIMQIQDSDSQSATVAEGSANIESAAGAQIYAQLYAQPLGPTGGGSPGAVDPAL